MNPLIIINYVLFAALFSLLIIELAGAIISILECDLYRKKVLEYLAPLWEITGTLSVFYLVNLAATYPGLLPAIDYLYLAPILFAAVFLIARDAYLAYSELSLEKKENKKHARAYGILTLLTMFLLITILSSSVSGGAVDPINLSVNFPYLLLNGFNILMFEAIITLASACAIVFFDLKYPKILATMAPFSLALLLMALVIHVPYIIAKAIGNPLYLAPVIILFVLMALVYLYKNKYAKFFAVPFLFAGILTFELLEYPYLFGGAVNLSYFVTPQPTTSYVLLFTLVGGGFLALALSLFFYVHHSKKRKRK